MRYMQNFISAMIVFFIVTSPVLCISVSVSNDVGSVSSKYSGDKYDTVSEKITLSPSTATLVDSWYYKRGSSSSKGVLPTIDKWYYSKNGKHSIHNYATGYGYPIEFSGNAYIDTAYVEVRNRCYLTGGGSSAPAYLNTRLDAYAKGYRTNENLAAETYLTLTQYTGTATVKNSAISNTDTTISPTIAQVYVSQSASNVNGNLYTKDWAQSYPSYDFAATYTTANGARGLSESSSAKGVEAYAQEWYYGGTHRLDASSKLTGIVDVAKIDSKSFYKRNEYVNFYMTKSHAEWDTAPSSSGILSASATAGNANCYINAKSNVVLRSDSDKAFAWTRTMSGYSSTIGNTDNLDNANYWKSGQWVTTWERTTSGDISSNYASLGSEIRRTSCTSSATTDITAKGVDITSWKWSPNTKTWNQLVNQYGMNKYYTSDLSKYVRWQFDGNGNLITKAGDMNADGKVIYEEIIQTINLYNKGEVTLAYAYKAIENWQASY